MSKYRLKLKVAEIIIQMESNFPCQTPKRERERIQSPERFNNFFYRGDERPDIIIEVNIVGKLPKLRGVKDIYITSHPADNTENWRLMSKGSFYIYKSILRNREQIMLVNKTFDKVSAYLLPKEAQGWVWGSSEIIYDFLQVLLVNYFALRNQGVFTHSVGVKDLTGRGLLFNGKSGSGKSTLARLWHKYSKAMVLNDDRIIVRKCKNKFFIYGSPWHGDFSDYLASRIESAPLEKIFFIHHAPKNTVRQIPQRMAFNLLYPALFPTFWDKGRLENIVSFCQDLMRMVPCYRLGFVDDKRIIGFVRKV